MLGHNQAQDVERNLEQMITHLNAGLYRHSRLERGLKARARDRSQVKPGEKVTALDEEEADAIEEEE